MFYDKLSNELLNYYCICIIKKTKINVVLTISPMVISVEILKTNNLSI